MEERVFAAQELGQGALAFHVLESASSSSDREAPLRVHPLTADEWIDKKEFFDAKDDSLQLNATRLNAQERDVRERRY